MGKITGASQNSFKSASYIYSKIKREWSNFGAANLLDDTDFPLYTAEVLKELGNGTLKEEDAILVIKDGKAHLPRDFRSIYAAYKCKCTNRATTPCEGSVNLGSLQSRRIFYTDTTYDTLSCKAPCKIDLECNTDRLISRVTIRQYIDDTCVTHNFSMRGLLKLSPNVREHCDKDCLNIHPTCQDEITINNGCILTNFNDGYDIFLQYYALPFDEEGDIMIPDIISVEKAIEWYIKLQILLNYWFTGELTDVQNKWQKAEQLYQEHLANAKFNSRLPAFSTLVNSVRNMRGINKTAFFAQTDHNKL